MPDDKQDPNLARVKDLEQALKCHKHLLAKAQAERDAAKAQLEALTEEVEHTHAALTAGGKKVCSFCLFVCETFEQMQEHLKTCAAHPMREVEAQRDELQLAVDKALVDHSAVEAERARLASEAGYLRADVDSLRQERDDSCHFIAQVSLLASDLFGVSDNLPRAETLAAIRNGVDSLRAQLSALTAEHESAARAAEERIAALEYAAIDHAIWDNEHSRKRMVEAVGQEKVDAAFAALAEVKP